jgi:biopolymer transport protein ExbD
MTPLFRKQHGESDTRAAFFALASLMMILLPTLMMVTNPEKIVSVPLALSNGASQFTAPHNGIVEKISVVAHPNSFTVSIDVRKSDVLAASGSVETKTWELESWTDTLKRLEAIHQMDSEQQKISLRPGKDHSAQDVIQWMDAIQLQVGLTEVRLEHPE